MLNTKKWMLAIFFATAFGGNVAQASAATPKEVLSFYSDNYYHTMIARFLKDKQEWLSESLCEQESQDQRVKKAYSKKNIGDYMGAYVEFWNSANNFAYCGMRDNIDVGVLSTLVGSFLAESLKMSYKVNNGMVSPQNKVTASHVITLLQNSNAKGSKSRVSEMKLLLQK